MNTKSQPSEPLSPREGSRRTIKVLFVSHTYVVAVNQQKIEALAQIPGIDLTLLAPTFWRAPLRDTHLEKTADPNYRIKSLPVVSPGNNDRFFFKPWEIVRLVRDLRPDIIHVEEEPWTFSLLEFILIGKMMGSKIVFFTWENLYRVHPVWYRLIEKINLKLADAALAGNTEAQQILLKRDFHKETLVLPQLGVDLKTFTKKDVWDLKKKLKLKDMVIGCFARLEEQKGITTLLTAFRKIKDKNVSLLLIGSGPMLPELQERAKADPRIVVPGVVSHSDMPDYFNLLDIFVLASETTSVWKEQFGHVLIEAMATGVPVVGSSSGAIPEVIGAAGLIFKEKDSEDLYQKLNKLVRDKKLRQDLADKGLQRVKERYTHDIIAQTTVQLYQKLLS